MMPTDRDQGDSAPILSGWMIVLIVLIVAGAAVGITALVTRGGSNSDVSLSTSTSGAPASQKTLTFRVPSGAMEPTIPIGSTISVAPLADSPPRRGDIVVFSPPPSVNCGGPAVSDLVKRVVGLPGETVSLLAGYVYIDDQRLGEKYLPGSEQGITRPGPFGHSYNLQHPYVVPADNYFVMGDNRSDSCDSRYWGTVPLADIVGVVRSIH
jgi:signal peptidase I